ncbi:lipopolysaccharide assembly protein LapA domain-containing protein [Glaciecola sp. KUL10]|uniref:lipopolysaccharide assembly protein LapA domain-containing protein n=1 Tax=Glaciecola sp. (strain KUL10) TaxID=2161813 RepID=UPI000D78B9F0|nr:lipopolysaccharide assembly protein LapA domain-containing protein [Glaciecola sp. KUL10]GBL02982.1 hypothetical protein KUL10_02590 [Glaciecola sp. KUL10]
MKGIILFIAVLLVLFIAIVIGSQNSQLITVNYLIAKAEIRLSTFMVINLAIGLLLGLLIMSFKFLSARMYNKILMHRIKKLSKES